MAIRQKIAPLPDNAAIVDPKTGFVTIAFQQWWQQLFQNSDTAFDDIDTKLDNNITTSRLLGRTTAGSGEIEELTLSQALDLIGSAAQGDILYRGASAWARLGAGTSGHFLKTLGAAANPAWSAISLSGSVYEAGPPGTVPTVASLTWVNQGTATATDTTGGIVLGHDCDGENHILKATAPAAPYDVYLRAETVSGSTAANTSDIISEAAIVLRDGVNADFLSIFMDEHRIAGDEQNEYIGGVNYWTSATVYSSTPVAVRETRPYKWIRANVTSTTVTIYVSNDGWNWLQIGTETIATRVGAITEYGFSIRSAANNTTAQTKVSYFSTTAPS